MITLGMLLNLGKKFQEFDILVEKTHPERMIMPLVKKARNFTKDFVVIVSKSGGFTVDEYLFLSDTVPRMH